MSLIDILLFLFIIAPITTLIHELGHVSGSFVFNATSITLHIGQGPSIIKKRIGKLQLNCYAFYMIGGLSSYQFNKTLQPFPKACIALLGPLYNFIVCMILFFLYGLNQQHILIDLSFWFNLWFTIVNIIPFRWKNRVSDGLIVWEAYKEAHQGVTRKKVDK